MIVLGIVLAATVAYVVMAGAVWARLEGGRQSDYRQHRDCDECTALSYGTCIGHPCRAAAAKARAASITFAALWLPMVPVWVGVRIGGKKRVGGIRIRRAERIAKRIADMEKDLGL